MNNQETAGCCKEENADVLPRTGSCPPSSTSIMRPQKRFFPSIQELREALLPKVPTSHL